MPPHNTTWRPGDAIPPYDLFESRWRRGQQASVAHYGTQITEKWIAENSWKTLLSTIGANDETVHCGWHIHAYSLATDPANGLELEITYGTSSTNLLVCRAPFTADLPGRIIIRARPTLALGTTTANITMAPTDTFRSAPRSIQVGAGALAPQATRFTALNACNLTVDGSAVALTVSQSIPLIQPSAVVSGAGIVEYDL